MERQTTVAREVTLEGIGLHTGNTSRITLKPSAAGTGIVFVRADLAGSPVIPARCEQVNGTAIRGTTIGSDPARIHTVEHVLAACAGLGVDNLVIEITNNEPPVMDGSARPFTDLLRKAGIVEQEAAKEYYVLSGPVTYESDGTKYLAEPAEDFSINCSVSYDHPFLKQQQGTFSLTPESFIKELAPARTFCFDYEIEALKRKNLARGGSLDNAIVVGINGIHNPDKTLRFPDEFVRHKTMDLVGDLYLLGKPLKAKITAVRCGHNHNVQFIKEIAKKAVLQRGAEAQEKKIMEAPSSSLTGTTLDIVEIQKIIPHRYPFLMIDRVTIVEELKKAVGCKCVSGNENFFQGHFPGHPIMPGVLIVEAMAQTSCVLFLSRPDAKNKIGVFMSIDGVKFRKPVVPGDVLELRVDVLRARERGGRIRGEAFVNNALVAEAEFMFAIVDREE